MKDGNMSVDALSHQGHSISMSLNGDTWIELFLQLATTSSCFFRFASVPVGTRNKPPL